MLADQFASAFSDAAFHSDWSAAHGQRSVGSDDLVEPMRFAAWVILRTIYLVAKPSDGFSVDIVQWRTADHFAAVIGRIAYDNDFH